MDDVLHIFLDYCSAEGHNDVPCLVVAKKTKLRGRISNTAIINYIFGDEALQIYNKLVGKEESE